MKEKIISKRKISCSGLRAFMMDDIAGEMYLNNLQVFCQ
jgi:hypothetical protein